VFAICLILMESSNITHIFIQRGVFLDKEDLSDDFLPLTVGEFLFALDKSDFSIYFIDKFVSSLPFFKLRLNSDNWLSFLSTSFLKTS